METAQTVPPEAAVVTASMGKITASTSGRHSRVAAPAFIMVRPTAGLKGPITAPPTVNKPPVAQRVVIKQRTRRPILNCFFLGGRKVKYGIRVKYSFKK